MEDNFNEDILKEIYYNEFEAMHKAPKSEAYIEITEKIKKIENILLQKDNNMELRTYMEYINERAGIEAENQFIIGFKTAVKIIMQSLK